MCHVTVCAAHSSSPSCHIYGASWCRLLQHAYINLALPFGGALQQTWLNDKSVFLRHWGMFLQSHHPQLTNLQPLAAAMMQGLHPTLPLQQLWWVRRAWQELEPPALIRPKMCQRGAWNSAFQAGVQEILNSNMKASPQQRHLSVKYSHSHSEQSSMRAHLGDVFGRLSCACVSLPVQLDLLLLKIAAVLLIHQHQVQVVLHAELVMHQLVCGRQVVGGQEQPAAAMLS